MRQYHIPGVSLAIVEDEPLMSVYLRADRVCDPIMKRGAPRRPSFGSKPRSAATTGLVLQGLSGTRAPPRAGGGRAGQHRLARPGGWRCRRMSRCCSCHRTRPSSIPSSGYGSGCAPTACPTAPSTTVANCCTSPRQHGTAGRTGEEKACARAHGPGARFKPDPP